MKNLFLFLLIVLVASCTCKDSCAKKCCSKNSAKSTLLSATRQQTEPQEPTWPVPEGAVDVRLSKSKVTQEGELVTMKVAAHNLKLLQSENIPKDFARLVLVATIKNPEVARFSDGTSVFEHSVDVSEIDKQGSYRFTNELIGYKLGTVSIIMSWKWPILTEGCCSTALLAILAGCQGAPNVANCVCATMAAMPAPGSWCCSIHPKVFRLWWNTYYTCPGASPY